MLLRLGSMRDVDLAIFDFDHDLSWAALFLTPEGHILGRFASRTAADGTKDHDPNGLAYALEQALQRFRTSPRGAAAPPGPRMDDYPAARRYPPKACFHCHHVREFRREVDQEAGRWRKEHEWVYPEPENIGLTMRIDQGNRVARVRPESPAARAGLEINDVLERIGTVPIASIADVRHALDRGPVAGTMTVSWRRSERSMSATLAVPIGWRETDLSWRWSLKSVQPAPPVYGVNLDADERRALGLTARQLAFRQENFLVPEARQAGVRIGDIIIGVGERRLEMTAAQFDVHFRLNQRSGETVTIEILRDGERIKIPIKVR